jgi:DNA-binding beta-propeller fold protein YncE
MDGSGSLSGARRRLSGAVALAGAMVLAGCSSGGTGTGAVAAQLRPERILAAPRDALSAAEPQPNGTVWVLAGGPASRGLFKFDLGTGRGLGSISVSGASRAVTQSAAGVIGLALGTKNTGALELLNDSTAAVIRTVALGAPARAVAVGADGTTFYVLTGTASATSVTIVNSASGRVLGTVSMPLDTVAIAPGAQQTTLYALQTDGRVSEIAIAGGKVMDTFTVGDSGDSLAISPDGATMYALKDVAGGTNVAVVDLATGSVHRVLPAPGHCRQVLVSADGNQLYELAGTRAYGNIQVFAA